MAENKEEGNTRKRLRTIPGDKRVGSPGKIPQLCKG